MKYYPLPLGALSIRQSLICACLYAFTFTGAVAAKAQQSSGGSTPAVPVAPTAPAPSTAPKPPASSQFPFIKSGPPSAKAQAEWDALFAEATKHTGEAEALLAANRLPEAEQSCFAAFAAAPMIGSGKQHVPFADQILGEVYLRMGLNAKAIYWLQSAIAHGTSSPPLLPQLALAYVRNGQDDQALLVLADQNFFKSSGWSNIDRPGTKNSDQLEATILLVLGDVASTNNRQDILNDYQAAARLVPHNALAALSCGSALLDLKHYDEAVPYFKTASKYGSPEIKSLADYDMRRLKGERQAQADALKAKETVAANKPTPK